MAARAGRSGAGWSLSIEGAVEKIDALRKMDKKVYNAMIKEVESAANEVAADAQSRIPDSPLSNWGRWTTGSSASGRGAVTVVRSGGGRDLSFDSGAARSGIKGKAARRFANGNLKRVAVVVSQKDPAGAIYELAGSVGQYWGAGNKGRSFTGNMNGKNGTKFPRALGAAYDAKGPAAAEKIEQIVDRYISDVNNAG